MRRRIHRYVTLGDVLDTTSDQSPNPTPITESQAVQSYNGSLYLTTDTPYITIGDEPEKSIPLLDLTKYLSPDDYNNFFGQFRYLPRLNLKTFIDTNLPQDVTSTINGDYGPIMKRALFNLFNVANADEIQKQGIDPWTWETKKNEAYALSLQPQNIQNQSAIVFHPEQLASATDRATQIVLAYGKLPPIANPTLEVQRQAAIKGLLQQGEFDAAQQIIDTYNNLDPATVAALTDPNTISYIPPDLAASVADGAPSA